MDAQNIKNTFQIVCNPNDSNLIALIGDGLIRILACTDFTWRQYGYSKGDQWNFSSAAWLSQDRLLVGTIDGKILLLEGGELKTIFLVGNLTVIDFKVKEE